MSDPANWTNLAEIVGLDDHRSSRVVSFRPSPDGGLSVVEECDTYFAVDLTPDQAARLVEWLTVNVCRQDEEGNA